MRDNPRPRERQGVRRAVVFLPNGFTLFNLFCGIYSIVLSAREYALLDALLARPGAILSRAQLEEKLYGWNEEVESNAVEVHIHALRRKFGADAIRNVRGVGWMIAESRGDDAA